MADMQATLGGVLPAILQPEAHTREMPSDQAARDAALDETQSWIVQAPAGAGKTELLTQRFLTLLSVVDEPEEILAITFTRAATAEMRGRILSALEEASRAPHPATPVANPDEPRTLALARRALARSQTLGWQLLEQPHRLDVQTIDSLCLRLAHGQPLLSRLGGRLQPTEQAAALYALAARNTFAMLGRAPDELEQALRHLLLLRDNHLANCQSLIADMLERREQWRHVFVLSGEADVDWSSIRSALEAPLVSEGRRVLGALHAELAADPALASELLTLAHYACENGSRANIGLLHGLHALPPADGEFLEHWTCLSNFLLTKGEWRRAVNATHGFPADGAGMSKAERRDYKQRMGHLIASLHRDGARGERLRTLLCQVPTLPSPRYDETQWQTLLSVFRVLRHAVAELHVVFAERNQVDFAELSIAASSVLADQENTRGLLASETKRHLLIDEFQDTSRRQHQLIGRLLNEWQPGDGRTCFLVGDPMQSIYIFRQAEVELFGRVQRQGLDCGSHVHPCAELRLSENFRSHAGLVDPLNTYFEAILAADPATGGRKGDVPFSRSHARRPVPTGPALHVHAFFSQAGDREGKETRRVEQVARVVELVEEQLAQAAGKDRYTIAILGRAKNHLAPIAAALRAREIPFRAVELESLAERQEILDLLSLARALLHPADRIAWLSVLRAPWCGLTLRDLHRLTGEDDRSLRETPVPELIRERGQRLSDDGRLRLARVAKVLAEAEAQRFRFAHTPSLAAWVERSWVSLGAPAYLAADERENAETFFRLLDAMAPDGIAVLDGSLDAALSRLCAAPDASVSEQFGVQLMTIHKAKGLGFEAVIVPALERRAGADGSPLITLLERAREDPEAGEAADEVLIAPLGTQGPSHRTYKWVQAQRRLRESGERKRLFYVACTRAKETLHLLGTAEVGSAGELRAAEESSLLACAWPALGREFSAAWARAQAPGEAAATRPATASTGPNLAISSIRSGQHWPSREAGGQVEQIAAAAEGGSLADSAEPLRLWRVPAGFAPRVRLENVTQHATNAGTNAKSGERAETRLARPQGSFEQRARGNAVHAMLEFASAALARERNLNGAAIAEPLSRVARAVLRRAGIAPGRLEPLARELLPTALSAMADPVGRWLLEPHREAQSEQSWSSVSGEARMRTLRVDRAFRAGAEPLASGSKYLWIVDYKTGASPGNQGGDADRDAYLETQREQWRPQLEAYGAALRAYHGAGLELRYGLYFPELLRLTFWAP